MASEFLALREIAAELAKINATLQQILDRLTPKEEEPQPVRGMQDIKNKLELQKRVEQTTKYNPKEYIWL